MTTEEYNGRFLLRDTCPTGKHTGAVEVHIAGGKMTMDHPIVYACGCTWDDVVEKVREDLARK